MSRKRALGVLKVLMRNLQRKESNRDFEQEVYKIRLTLGKGQLAVVCETD